MSNIFIGTSGYTYKDWKERFYPLDVAQKDWLMFYSHHFQTVEINATFYGSFKKETLQHWHDQTPKEFLFTIKGSRFITHIRRLQVTKTDISLFFSQLEPLAEKLSCVLWQLPGNFRLTEENLKRLQQFLALLPGNVRQAIEFRDSSWFVEALWRLLQEHNCAFVISQTSEFPTYEQVTADFSYIRFHGPGKLYASKYSEEELQEWAKKIGQLAEKGNVYCYFNNDYYGYAIENANMLKQLIGRSNTHYSRQSQMI